MHYEAIRQALLHKVQQNWRRLSKLEQLTYRCYGIGKKVSLNDTSILTNPQEGD